MMKNSNRLVAISFVFFLAACSLQVPDAEICFTKPDYSAFCAFTLKQEERTIDQATWHSMQPGRFSLTVDEFAKYQKFIEKACELQTCTNKEKKAQQVSLKNFEKVKNQYKSYYGDVDESQKSNP